MEVARALRAEGLSVKVIDDWHVAPIPEVARANLYAGAKLNLGVSSGPLCLSLALGAPTLLCKLVVESAGFYTSAAGWVKAGVPPGSQMGPAVTLLWDHDDSDPGPIVNAALEAIRNES
jgi:hypothetical protein